MPYESEHGRFTLALGGDIMPSRRLAPYREPEFLALRDIFKNADAAFANLESLIIRYGEGYPAVRTGTYMVTEPELLEDLKWFGFNLLSCANSHSLNFGEEGLLLQNRYLNSAELAHAGTGENLRQASSPAYLDTPNGRVALIAATAHLPSPHHRALHQRLDFRGKPGVNPLGFRTTFTVDGEAFAALERIGAALGLDAERQRVLDHGFHTEAETGTTEEKHYRFRGDLYERGTDFDIRTQCNEDDVEENLRQIGEARRQADWVLVSLHNQDMIGKSWLKARRRIDIVEQPEFVADFAHRCVDAGADAFAGHGPHVPFGLEIYKGKPIFYSLGNLILQNETLRHIPANPYERSGMSPYATPGEFFNQRSRNDTRGHPATREFWESFVAVCHFDKRSLKEIQLHPVDLGFGRPRSQRGRPMLAAATLASKILERAARLSEVYGTKIECVDGVGVVRA